MTTLDTRPIHDEVPGNYLTFRRGILSWIFTLDHKRIGLMYMWSVLGSFLLGGIFALLVRTELLTPGPTITSSADTYNQWFTLHGAIMVFLVIIPVAVPFFQSKGLSMQDVFSLQALFGFVVLLTEVPSGYWPTCLVARTLWSLAQYWPRLGTLVCWSQKVSGRLRCLRSFLV